MRIVIHDPRTAQDAELGFSIKSQLGSPSTLLNAGRTTNFIYRLSSSNITKADIRRINAISSRSKIKDRIECIKGLNCNFIFEKLENTIFESNLVLIDSALPKILSESLLIFFSSTLSKISDLVADVAISNPVKYNLTHLHPFYPYKIKRFLTDVALGMMPSKVWTGLLDATGGYLVVKNNGDILCYHIYKRNEFEDYLYSNTKLETASTDRHDFGKIYEEDGQLFFKLNLQIRFV